jgi:hypothetical protein
VSADRLGALYGLNVAGAVLPGSGPRLRAAIAALPRGDDSPLARLGTVHFGRWVVIEGWPRAGSEVLWFSATFDGTLERFLAGMRKLLRREADAVWRHCAGWPGVEDPAAFERWMHEHRMPTHYFLAAAPQATVAGLQRALARREAVIELARETPGLSPAELGARIAQLRGAGGA